LLFARDRPGAGVDARHRAAHAPPSPRRGPIDAGRFGHGRLNHVGQPMDADIRRHVRIPHPHGSVPLLRGVDRGAGRDGRSPGGDDDQQPPAVHRGERDAGGPRSGAEQRPDVHAGRDPGRGRLGARRRSRCRYLHRVSDRPGAAAVDRFGCRLRAPRLLHARSVPPAPRPVARTPADRRCHRSGGLAGVRPGRASSGADPSPARHQSRSGRGGRDLGGLSRFGMVLPLVEGSRPRGARLVRPPHARRRNGLAVPPRVSDRHPRAERDVPRPGRSRRPGTGRTGPGNPSAERRRGVRGRVHRCRWPRHRRRSPDLDDPPTEDTIGSGAGGAAHHHGSLQRHRQVDGTGRGAGGCPLDRVARSTSRHDPQAPSAVQGHRGEDDGRRVPGHLRGAGPGDPGRPGDPGQRPVAGP